MLVHSKHQRPQLLMPLCSRTLACAIWRRMPYLLTEERSCLRVPHAVCIVALCALVARLQLCAVDKGVGSMERRWAGESIGRYGWLWWLLRTPARVVRSASCRACPVAQGPVLL